MDQNLTKSIRYDKNNRQISFPNSDSNGIPIREFLTHLRSQGVDANDVLQVFQQAQGSRTGQGESTGRDRDETSRSNTSGSGTSRRTNE